MSISKSSMFRRLGTSQSRAFNAIQNEAKQKNERKKDREKEKQTVNIKFISTEII